MKPEFARLTSGTNELISVIRFQLPHFYKRWLYHEEPEIIYVIKSEGKSIIGDTIGRFSPGDLYVLGSNLPHILLNDSPYFENNSPGIDAIVIHLNKSLMQNDLLEYDEFKSINTLLTIAARGLYIADTELRFLPIMTNLYQAEGLARIKLFFDLMSLIIECDKTKMIASEGYHIMAPKENNARLDAVFEFITASFDQKITLNDLAEKACMTPPAFCAFFKKTTGKTPFEFLNDIRIAYACRLLTSKQYNISQVAFECGFSNLSFFNRQFKAKMNMTPRAYKKSITM